MGIDKQTNIEADLQIGPTTLGMVRIYVSGANIDIPMDFTPGEAREIAAELLQAAATAAGTAKSGKKSSPRNTARGSNAARARARRRS